MGRERKRKERRRGPRIQVSRLTAQYWTGAAPQPRPVPEISISGCVIETEESYYPGTLMRVSLDAAADDKREPAVSIVLWARVLRRLAGGIAVEFVFQNCGEIQTVRELVAGLERKENGEKTEFWGSSLRERSVAH